MADEMTVRRLRLLADPTRLHIVELLSHCCCGRASIREDGGVEGPTAGEICCHVTGADRISSTVSHHLHELEEGGLIRIQRRGKSMVCTLIPEALEALGRLFLNLAQGEAHTLCCPEPIAFGTRRTHE